jgi:hypothetical protein
MPVYLSTYRELVQWGWDTGLLRLPEDREMFRYAAGLECAMGEMAEDFHALEMIGQDVGAWMHYGYTCDLDGTV